MKFGIIGNCQGRGMARSLSNLVPGCEIEMVHMNNVPGATEEERQRWVDMLTNCTVVFTQPLSDPSNGALVTDRLEESCRKVVRYPYLAFSGLHPDCHYIKHEGKHLAGPMGSYHSVLTAAAFLEGISETQTASLFNSFTYASLGYFAQYAISCRSFERDTGALGYDFASFYGAAGDAPFMHTINHPAIAIVHDMSVQALAKAGIRPSVERLETIPDDELATSIIWPVYPEIGQRIGKAGSMRFQTDPGRVDDLAQFVARSYEVYRLTDGVFDQPPAVQRARAFLAREVIRNSPA